MSSLPMESSSNYSLAKGSTSALATSNSAGNLTDQLSSVKISTASDHPDLTKRGIKRPISLSGSDSLMPATKKNRDYLPKESKPVYFDLKKLFKKKSQWTAHELFMNNCASTGNFPRSIQWKCAPPWEFTNQELTHQWATIQQKAPAELCKLIALDCKAKTVNCQASIDSLLADLSKLIPDNDFEEIKNELHHDYQSASDRLYAEKILGRNNAAKPRGDPTATPKPKSKTSRPAKKPQSQGGQPRGRGGRPRNRRRGNREPDNTATVRTRPGTVKQDLMRQLNDLSKAIKLMK